LSEYDLSILAPGPTGLLDPRQSIGMQFGTGPHASWKTATPYTLVYYIGSQRYTEYLPADGDHNVPRVWQGSVAASDAGNVRLHDVVGDRWLIAAIVHLQIGVTPTTRVYAVHQAAWNDLVSANEAVKLEYEYEPGKWRRAQRSTVQRLCGTDCVTSTPFMHRVYGCTGTQAYPNPPGHCVGGLGRPAIMGMAVDPTASDHIFAIGHDTGNPGSHAVLIRINLTTQLIAQLYGFGDSVYSYLTPQNLMVHQPLDERFRSCGLCVGKHNGVDGVYFTIGSEHRVRWLPTAGGAPISIAGTGEDNIGGLAGYGGYSGDGGPATSARLGFAMDLAISNDGTKLYLCDTGNAAVRQVDLASGIITTIIGGKPDYANFIYNTNQGNGGLGTAAALTWPCCIYVHPLTNQLYVAQWPYGTIRVWDPTTHIITQVAGPPEPYVPNFGPQGLLPNWLYFPDGTVTNQMSCCAVSGMALDTCGNLLFVDSAFRVIRTIVCGRVRTLAGDATNQMPLTEVVPGETVLGTSRSSGGFQACCPVPSKGGVYVAQWRLGYPGIIMDPAIFLVR
jgi:DNA-binding beta-propeller fold protein YncE